LGLFSKEGNAPTIGLLGHFLASASWGRIGKVAGYVRYLIPALLVLAQLIALVPTVSAQEAETRLRVTFDPPRITSQVVGGCEPNTACPIQRGVTYTVNVAFDVNVDADSMVFDLEPGGLEIEPSLDATDPVAAGGRGTFSLDITIPEAGGRKDRTFYFGRVRLFGEQGTFILPLSVSVPAAKITWGQLLDPVSGEKASSIAQVGSGGEVSRRVNINSSFDVEDFEIRTNAPDRVTLTGVPDNLVAGRNVPITIGYEAPIVNRRTRTDVVLSPGSGLQALKNTLRLRLVVLPVQITWSPPFIRRTLDLRSQKAALVTVNATSNYTVDNVTFKTSDLGLTPFAPGFDNEPRTMQAGVPVPVRIVICPGYAATQYFLGVTAFQNRTKPLNKRLQIRSNVIDATGQGPDDTAPPCNL
jgi:hypothetical protein